MKNAAVLTSTTANTVARVEIAGKPHLNDPETKTMRIPMSLSNHSSRVLPYKMDTDARSKF